MSLRNCEFGELGKKVYLRNCSKVYLRDLGDLVYLEDLLQSVFEEL